MHFKPQTTFIAINLLVIGGIALQFSPMIKLSDGILVFIGVAVIAAFTFWITARDRASQTLPTQDAPEFTGFFPYFVRALIWLFIMASVAMPFLLLPHMPRLGPD